MHNSCLVHIFLIESHWKFFKLLTTKIAYDLRVCHDLDLKLFGNGQGHWQKKYSYEKFVSGPYLSFLIHSRIAYDLKVCYDLEPRASSKSLF